jgi:hypothetical protein
MRDFNRLFGSSQSFDSLVQRRSHDEGTNHHANHYPVDGTRRNIVKLECFIHNDQRDEERWNSAAPMNSQVFTLGKVRLLS